MEKNESKLKRRLTQPAVPSPNGRGTVKPRVRLLCLALVLLSSCKWKMHPTYPADQIAASLRHMCSKDYRLSVETRHEGNTLQALVWKVGLFGGRAYDLQGMSKAAAETMEHVFLCATRIALSTDAPLEFIEVKMVDVLTGATVTLWRYVPDIRDSMYQRFGDTEYFSRLVVEINIDKARLGSDPKMHNGAKSDLTPGVHWDKPITMAEFLAKQIILRARRDGTETLQAHADLSQPATLGVVIDNWSSIEEEGPEHIAKVTDMVHKSAQTVLKGYRFNGFRGLTLRDSQGAAVGSWAL
jgi:hypothetical protein